MFMKEKMIKAAVGDENYKDDPTTHILAERVQKIFNKEASLFVPTGIMGNQIAIYTHT